MMNSVAIVTGASQGIAKTVAQRAISTFGRIDALINIAGAVPQIDLFEMTDEQWGSVWRSSSMAHGD
jgi:NAD(P)-dependent dehydrogenase (short-subunit alcohol dehydrogenase family)